APSRPTGGVRQRPPSTELLLSVAVVRRGRRHAGIRFPCARLVLQVVFVHLASFPLPVPLARREAAPEILERLPRKLVPAKVRVQLAEPVECGLGERASRVK